MTLRSPVPLAGRGALSSDVCWLRVRVAYGEGGAGVMAPTPRFTRLFRRFSMLFVVGGEGAGSHLDAMVVLLLEASGRQWERGKRGSEERAGPLIYAVAK